VANHFAILHSRGADFPLVGYHGWQDPPRDEPRAPIFPSLFPRTTRSRVYRPRWMVLPLFASYRGTAKVLVVTTVRRMARSGGGIFSYQDSNATCGFEWREPGQKAIACAMACRSAGQKSLFHGRGPFRADRKAGSSSRLWKTTTWPSALAHGPQPDSACTNLLPRICGIVFNKIVRVILWLPFVDTQCGFKAFRRENCGSFLNSSGLNARI